MNKNNKISKKTFNLLLLKQFYNYKKIKVYVDLDGDGQLETEYYFLQDQLGNVEALLDNQGRKLEEYEYQGYGHFKVFEPDNTKPLIEQVRINENGKLAILFTEPIMTESINNQNIQLLDSNSQPVTIEFQLDEEKRQIIIAPALTNGSNYTLSIQNVYDLNSNKIDTYTKSFTAQISSIIEDTKPPEIETVYQDSGNLIVQFTEDLKPETVNQNSIILKRNGNAVAGTTEMINSKTLKFISAQSLIVNLDYELTIDPSLKDLADKPVSQQLINFTYLDLPVSFYSKQNQRTEISTTAYNNFHLFQGREYDKELDLYYFRNRYLDNNIGVWITNDLARYKDKYNLYQGFSLNPINYSDPFGLWTFPEIKKYLNNINFLEKIAKIYKSYVNKDTLYYINAQNISSTDVYYEDIDYNLANMLVNFFKGVREYKEGKKYASVQIPYVKGKTAITWGKYDHTNDSIKIICENCLDDVRAAKIYIHEYIHFMNDKYKISENEIRAYFFKDLSITQEQIKNIPTFYNELSAFVYQEYISTGLKNTNKWISEIMDLYNEVKFVKLSHFSNASAEQLISYKNIKVANVDCKFLQKLINESR